MKIIFIFGYLGGGKTTLCRNILQALKGKKTAVIANDFAESDVDGLLLAESSECIKSISGGSIFCACKSYTFVDTLIEVVSADPEYIIVEASGLANPSSLDSVIKLVEDKLDTKLDAVCVGVVDIVNFERIISVVKMAKTQLALSDIIVLNKADLCTASELDFARKVANSLSPNCEIIVTKYCKFDYSKIINLTKVEKIKFTNLMDINTYCIRLKFANISRRKLEDIAEELSHIVDRIKGIIKLDGNNYIYEFVGGKSSYIATNKPCNESFIVALGVSAGDIKSKVKAVMAKYE